MFFLNLTDDCDCVVFSRASLRFHMDQKISRGMGLRSGVSQWSDLYIFFQMIIYRSLISKT